VDMVEELSWLDIFTINSSRSISVNSFILDSSFIPYSFFIFLLIYNCYKAYIFYTFIF
jgi:hypothetical protein